MSTAKQARIEFGGELLFPGDPGYDDARRLWNGAIDRRPALIARCLDATDVVTALRHAREHDLTIAVRGGGHGVAGHAVCDGGVVIDLSPMRAVRVEPGARVAYVQAGVLLGELDAAAQAFGLATPAGIVSHTGVAGLTLGGGIGWLTRKLGATVDHLRSARVVTADGALVTASELENPDLFWGLRGGGGNFGIVTEFEFGLHPIGPTVLGGAVYYPLEDAADVLRRYRDVVADAPDELTTILGLRQAPPFPSLPHALHGRPVVAVQACWSGDLEQGERAVRPLRELGTPLLDLLAPRPFIELQQANNAAVPHGWHYYWKSIETPPFEDAVIDILVEHTARITSPRSYTIIFQLGGALAHTRQLPRRRRPGPRAGRLRRHEVRTARHPQTHLGSGQRLPPQPKHRASDPRVDGVATPPASPRLRVDAASDGRPSLQRSGRRAHPARHADSRPPPATD